MRISPGHALLGSRHPRATRPTGEWGQNEKVLTLFLGLTKGTAPWISQMAGRVE